MCCHNRKRLFTILSSLCSDGLINNGSKSKILSVVSVNPVKIQRLGTFLFTLLLILVIN